MSKTLSIYYYGLTPTTMKPIHKKAAVCPPYKVVSYVLTIGTLLTVRLTVAGALLVQICILDIE